MAAPTSSSSSSSASSASFKESPPPPPPAPKPGSLTIKGSDGKPVTARLTRIKGTEVPKDMSPEKIKQIDDIAKKVFNFIKNNPKQGRELEKKIAEIISRGHTARVKFDEKTNEVTVVAVVKGVEQEGETKRGFTTENNKKRIAGVCTAVKTFCGEAAAATKAEESTRSKTAATAAAGGTTVKLSDATKAKSTTPQGATTAASSSATNASSPASSSSSTRTGESERDTKSKDKPPPPSRGSGASIEVETDDESPSAASAAKRSVPATPSPSTQRRGSIDPSDRRSVRGNDNEESGTGEELSKDNDHEMIVDITALPDSLSATASKANDEWVKATQLAQQAKRNYHDRISQNIEGFGLERSFKCADKFDPSVSITVDAGTQNAAAEAFTALAKYYQLRGGSLGQEEIEELQRIFSYVDVNKKEGILNNIHYLKGLIKKEATNWKEELREIASLITNPIMFHAGKTFEDVLPKQYREEAIKKCYLGLKNAANSLGNDDQILKGQLNAACAALQKISEKPQTVTPIIAPPITPVPKPIPQGATLSSQAADSKLTASAAKVEPKLSEAEVAFQKFREAEFTFRFKHYETSAKQAIQRCIDSAKGLDRANAFAAKDAQKEAEAAFKAATELAKIDPTKKGDMDRKMLELLPYIINRKAVAEEAGRGDLLTQAMIPNWKNEFEHAAEIISSSIRNRDGRFEDLLPKPTLEKEEAIKNCYKGLTNAINAIPDDDTENIDIRARLSDAQSWLKSQYPALIK